MELLIITLSSARDLDYRAVVFLADFGRSILRNDDYERRSASKVCLTGRLFTRGGGGGGERISLLSRQTKNEGHGVDNRECQRGEATRN